MTAVTIVNCPRCPATVVGAELVGNVHYIESQRVHTGVFREWYECFASCQSCTRAFVIIFSRRYTSRDTRSSPATVNGDPCNEGFELVVTVPNQYSDPPQLEYVPPAIAEVFAQGFRSQSIGDYDAAGTMFRKALDMATRELLREHSPKTAEEDCAKWLKARIIRLKDLGIVVDVLHETAMKIKDIGDIAAHDETLMEKDECLELGGFTETFLNYTFTLPGKLATTTTEETEEAGR